MSDIDLYLDSVASYENLQNRRPDYPLAQKAFFDLVSIKFKGRQNINVADFCCGTGNNTKLVGDHFLINKSSLIDINEKFLDIARNSHIRALDLVTLESDILKVELRPEHDLVISMFAYHHVTDSDKAKYIRIAKDALKKGGILLVGEIYIPDKETTIIYYEELINETPFNLRTPEYERFLRQTAASDQFEYKVSREFAHNQLNDAGFQLAPEDAFMIWPKDKRFGQDVGMFVEAWVLG